MFDEFPVIIGWNDAYNEILGVILCNAWFFLAYLINLQKKFSHLGPFFLQEVVDRP